MNASLPPCAECKAQGKHRQRLVACAIFLYHRRIVFMALMALLVSVFLVQTTAEGGQAAGLVNRAPVNRAPTIRVSTTRTPIIRASATHTPTPTARAVVGGRALFSMRPITTADTDPTTGTYFVITTRPGANEKHAVRVTNSGNAPGTVNLYPIDATTGQTSGVVYLSQNYERNDVGSWLKLNIQKLTLAPGQSKVIPFKLVIPSITRPGQHVGGIAAEDISQKSLLKSTTIQIDLARRVIIAVQVDLPGPPREQLAASGIQVGLIANHQTLLVGLNNAGTMMLKPYGTLQVTDIDGHLLQNLTLNLNTFLPQTTIDYPVLVNLPALGMGDYIAVLTLTYGHKHILRYQTPFAITTQQLPAITPPLTLSALVNGENASLWPWFIGLVLFLIILLIGSTFYWRRKIRELQLEVASGRKQSG
ncbi:MAG: DUF916 domain-containing protein [Ktedonobacteraceae bacterium]